MRAVIDEDICNKHDISLNDALILLALSRNRHIVEKIDILEHSGIINRNSMGEYIMSDDYADKLSDILIDSAKSYKNKDLSDENRLTLIATQIRNLFPSGFKLDEHGRQTYPWRVSVKETVKRLKMLELLIDEKLDEEECINATKKYLETKASKTYEMRLCKYFIIKDGSSDLYDYIMTLRDSDVSSVDYNCEENFELVFDE